MSETADIVVVGGGPVGAALALALADTPFKAIVLESRRRNAPVADPRPLALSYGSRLLLERLTLWSRLEASATPIEQIHVSQQGGFGRVAMTAAEANLPALGYVVDYARLYTALSKAAGQRDAIRHGEVTRIDSSHDVATVEYADPDGAHAVSAKLAVIADGGFRDPAAGKLVDYGQSAVVAMVKSERPHRNVAFERFTSRGPLGLLPCGTDIALVWSMGTDAATACSAEPEESFLRRLYQTFGRLGAFSAVGARACFPLTLRYGSAPAPHTLAIGNAAQTLHPVAGQGFNLGLRDAWELADVLRSTEPVMLGSPAMLDAYRRRRRVDRSGGIAFTDALVRIFSNDLAPVRLARSFGLAMLGALPPAKDFLVRRMTFGARG
ncbi:MAG TPA: FAD-dependent monooxygenase [Burkholderiales bacterium]|nr:FAD-dependent monooxygenase [Burkholderiales bacterium]